MHIHGILHIHIYIYNEKLTIAISSQDKSVIECIALHHRIDGNTIQYNTILYYLSLLFAADAVVVTFTHTLHLSVSI
ncbi:MAG: hypothetical protein ACI90V_012185 [Bacillariaceae sp.]|jgi:hypothetical protein